MPVVIRGDDSKPMFGANNPLVAYLDHDHRERENIRFFTVYPLLVQDLWRSPSRGVTLIIRVTSNGIQVLGDLGKTKIRDPCMAVGIHEDIWLDMGQ